MEILKRWLEYHGLKKSGKKSELINRVNQSIGLIKVDPKVDGGKRYDIKSKGEGLPTSSYKLEITTPARGWNNFPGTNIPVCSTMDIYISTSLNRLMKCFYRTTVATKLPHHLVRPQRNH